MNNNTSLKSRYTTAKPIGTSAITNNSGLLIYEPDENDRYDCDLICAWFCGDKIYAFHKHRVHYSTTGRAYIRKADLRIYLDAVMRV